MKLDELRSHAAAWKELCAYYNETFKHSRLDNAHAVFQLTCIIDGLIIMHGDPNAGGQVCHSQNGGSSSQ